MSRPTNDSKYAQADRWMKGTFGQGMQDHLSEQLADPISVAVVEVAKLLRKAGSANLLTKWRNEDVKSPAGIQAKLTPHAALALILLQLRLKRTTLVTELTHTFLQLSPTHRRPSAWSTTVRTTRPTTGSGAQSSD